MKRTPIVAFYGRYSTDKQKDTSIEDQLRNCQRYADRECWEISAVYADRGISGVGGDCADCDRMLRDVEAKRIDLVMVDDLSRLSRDRVHPAMIVETFQLIGARLVSVSDGIDTDREDAMLNTGMRNVLNSMFVDDLKKKTHRGIAGKVLRHQSTGGSCLGYMTEREYSADKLDETGRPARAPS